MKRLALFLVLYSSLCYSQNLEVGIELFATGLTQPLDIQNAGDSRLFVAQKNGTIVVINDDGTVNTEPFLNLDLINTDSEQGLLGLAFHPDYATNGFFYIHYINDDGNTSISRFTVSDSNPDIANPNSELQLLLVEQPTSIHNAGGLDFGQDDYLYIAIGDGGTFNTAQDGQSLLGKILRIDIDNQDLGLNYAIPSTNPFVNQSGFRNEIWDYGLRNPFRISIDMQTNNLWIGEVGAATIEEINRSIAGGNNFGWRCYEGNLPFNTDGCPSSSAFDFPVAEYLHDNGDDDPFRCSIGGGYVYRGSEFPDMEGLYFFTDLCSNEIGYINAANPQDITYSEQFLGNGFVTFGIDINNELYIAGINNGRIYRIVDNNPLVNEIIPEAIGFDFFPNPATNNLTLTMNLPDELSEDRLLFFDITGKLILSRLVGNGTTTIPVNEFSTGVYIAILETSGYNQKIVIN